MNITDLRSEFTRQADDAPDGNAVLAEESRRYSGRARARTRRSLIAVAAAVVLVAGGATAIATTLNQPTHTAGPPTPQDLVHAFTVPQTDDDRLTGRALSDNLRPESARLIGESKHAKEWVAVDRQGNICLVTVLPNGVIGTGCNPPEEFQRSGAGVSVSGGARNEPSRSAAARLLPSDIPESSLNDAARQIRNATSGFTGWIETFYRNSTPLIVMSPNFAVDTGSITITRDDGTPITIHLG